MKMKPVNSKIENMLPHKFTTSASPSALKVGGAENISNLLRNFFIVQKRDTFFFNIDYKTI